VAAGWVAATLGVLALILASRFQYWASDLSSV
jgi:hypothetical protein